MDSKYLVGCSFIFVAMILSLSAEAGVVLSLKPQSIESSLVRCAGSMALSTAASIIAEPQTQSRAYTAPSPSTRAQIPMMSADGQFLFYLSNNSPNSITSGRRDLYRLMMPKNSVGSFQAETAKRISVTRDQLGVNAVINSYAVAGPGNLVLFSTTASNLEVSNASAVPANTSEKIYRWDEVKNSIEFLTVGSLITVSRDGSKMLYSAPNSTTFIPNTLVMDLRNRTVLFEQLGAVGSPQFYWMDPSGLYVYYTKESFRSPVGPSAILKFMIARKLIAGGAEETINPLEIEIQNTYNGVVTAPVFVEGVSLKNDIILLKQYYGGIFERMDKAFQISPTGAPVSVPLPLNTATASYGLLNLRAAKVKPVIVKPVPESFPSIGYFAPARALLSDDGRFVLAHLTQPYWYNVAITPTAVGNGVYPVVEDTLTGAKTFLTSNAQNQLGDGVSGAAVSANFLNGIVHGKFYDPLTNSMVAGVESLAGVVKCNQALQTSLPLE